MLDLPINKAAENHLKDKNCKTCKHGHKAYMSPPLGKPTDIRYACLKWGVIAPTTETCNDWEKGIKRWSEEKE